MATPLEMSVNIGASLVDYQDAMKQVQAASKAAFDRVSTDSRAADSRQLQSASAATRTRISYMAQLTAANLKSARTEQQSVEETTRLIEKASEQRLRARKKKEASGAASGTSTGAPTIEQAEADASAALAVTAQIQDTIDNIRAGIQDMAGISKALASGDEAAALESGAALTTKVGQALLSAPYPLNIAGAVLLGIGMVGEAVAGLMRIFGGQQRSSMELTRAQIEEDQRINDLLMARLDLAEQALQLRTRDLLTAKDLLRVTREQQQASYAKDNRSGAFTTFTSTDLVNQIDRINSQLTKQQQLVAKSEDILKHGSWQEMAEFLTAQGVGEAWAVPVGAMEQFVENAKAAAVSIESTLGMANNEVERRIALRELEMRILAENITLETLRGRILGDEQIALQASAQSARAGLILALEDLKLLRLIDPYTDLASLDTAGIQELLKSLMEAGNLPADIAELALAWQDTTAEADAYEKKLSDSVTSTLSLIDQQKQLLKLDRGLGRIKEIQFQKEMRTLLDQQLDTLDAELVRLHEAGATQETILEVQIRRRQVEQEILDLQQSQADTLGIIDEATIAALRQRIELERTFRDKGGGQLTDSQRTTLRAINDQIVTAWTSANPSATTADIAQFRATLPQYLEGGGTGSGGPAMLHAKEWVLNREATRAVGESTLSRLNQQAASAAMQGSIPAGAGLLAAASGGSIGATSVAINLAITINAQGADAAQVATLVAEVAPEAISREFEKIIERRNIDLRRSMN